MAGKQAKILSVGDVNDLLLFASCTRHPVRNRVIVLLSAKAGLRAGEIASLTWDMVVDAAGQIGNVIELRDHAAKKGSGRLIPMHPELADGLSAWRQASTGSGNVVRSERGGPMTALSIVVWFKRAYQYLGLDGCSSHSGRRTFITRAARLVYEAGGSLRDVQLLAGHRSIQTTQRYIDGDTDAQARLDDLMQGDGAKTAQRSEGSRIDTRPAPARLHGRYDRRLFVDNRMEENSYGNPNLAYAIRQVHATCCLAGSASYLDDIRADLRDCGISRAVRDHDTPVLFDWLVEALSFQGISDAVAAGYIDQHGSVRWAEIAEALSRNLTCPKLGGYWRFYNCRYRKGSRTCSEPGHFDACALPRHPLRNGHLNQMAYSLFLFMRDVADDDFVGWIDRQLGAVDPGSPDRLPALREAIIGPLRNVYGVADKVLAMALSSLLLGAGKRRPLWVEVGATFVAVDTLVHNFLHRTGILRRLCANHPYGEGCYRPGGCAGILGLLAANIDAREFNPAFPATFPRFVQNAIWRYCAGNGLAICNGNRIDDDSRCDNGHCQLFRRCDRIALRSQREKITQNQ